MYLRDDVKVKIVEFNSRFPFPTTSDEDSANWTHKLCEQLAFSFPTDGWGHKSAGPGRPHSADVVCIMSPFMKQPFFFIGWDIITSAGSPSAALNLSGDSINLSGQIFEPVAAINWLGSNPPPVPPPTNVEEKLDFIIKTMQQYHGQEMDAILAPRITRIA